MIDKTNMPDEVLDLVNENDEVIGEVTKGEANKNPQLIHRDEIAIFLIDSKKRILFQQRSMKKRVSPGLWAESCAGHVVKGKSYDEAAHMELQEELGFDANLIFVYKELDKQINETRFRSWYIGKYENQLIHLEKEEVEQTALMTREEFLNLDPTITHPTVIRWAIRLWNGEFDELIEKLG